MSTADFKLRSGRGRIDHYQGIFNVNGTGAVTGVLDTTGVSPGATAVRTGVGKITITFPRYYDKVYSYDAQLHMSGPNASNFAQIDSFTANSNGYAVMVIGTYGTSSAADFTGTVTWSIEVRA